MNRFARIGETIAQYKERRKVEVVSAYERKVVKKILVGLGLDRVSLALEKQEVDADESDTFMTMAWLAGKYPSFPVILQVRETWTPDIVDFFKVRSRKNSFWAVWEEVSESLVGNKKPIGCVFPFPAALDLGHGVIHNAKLPNVVITDEHCKTAVQMTREELNKPTVVLELLDTFIRRLSAVWSPV